MACSKASHWGALPYLPFPELDCIAFDLLLYQFREWEVQFQLPRADFDCHFPQACYAQEPLIQKVFYVLACHIAQVGTTANEPQKRMRIEQQFHSV